MIRYIIVLALLIGCNKQDEVIITTQPITLQGIWHYSNETLNIYGDSIYNSKYNARGTYYISGETFNQELYTPSGEEFIFHEPYQLTANQLKINTKIYTR